MASMGSIHTCCSRRMDRAFLLQLRPHHHRHLRSYELAWCNEHFGATESGTPGVFGRDSQASAFKNPLLELSASHQRTVNLTICNDYTTVRQKVPSSGQKELRAKLPIPRSQAAAQAEISKLRRELAQRTRDRPCCLKTVHRSVSLPAAINIT